MPLGSMDGQLPSPPCRWHPPGGTRCLSPARGETRACVPTVSPPAQPLCGRDRVCFWDLSGRGQSLPGSCAQSPEATRAAHGGQVVSRPNRLCWSSGCSLAQGPVQCWAQPPLWGTGRGCAPHPHTSVRLTGPPPRGLADPPSQRHITKAWVPLLALGGGAVVGWCPEETRTGRPDPLLHDLSTQGFPSSWNVLSVGLHNTEPSPQSWCPHWGPGPNLTDKGAHFALPCGRGLSCRRHSHALCPHPAGNPSRQGGDKSLPLSTPHLGRAASLQCAVRRGAGLRRCLELVLWS